MPGILTDVTIWWRLVRIPIVPEDFWYKNPLDFNVRSS